MAGIPENTIEEVRRLSDIVEVVSGYIPLKKAGANYRALCPFHEEKTPSFNVNPARQIFHCFGCGEGGNVFSFVMKYEKIPFPDAVRLLAGKLGIAIKTETGKPGGAREKLYKVMETAARFYHQRLKDAAPDSPVGRYLEKRGLTAGMVNLFRLGWAPDRWDALAQALGKAGFAREMMESAGLCKPSSTGGLIDRLRNRLIFPVNDAGGKVIAFGGRVIDSKLKDAPKYINSPETLIYHKGHALYGQNLARSSARAGNSVFLVEGYMDVIALRGAGIENVVAVSGTAFTSGQATIIKRMCDEVVALFDSDTAGVAAVKRSSAILLDAGLRVRVLSIPGAKDPDEFISNYGAEKFLELAGGAAPFPEYIINTALEGADLASVEGRTMAAREALPFLRRIKDRIERAGYIQSLADRAGVSADALNRESVATPARGRRGGARQAEPTKRISARRQAEKILIRIMLDHPEYIEKAKARMGAGNFSDTSYRAIFQMLGKAAGDGVTGVAELMNMTTDKSFGPALADIAFEKGLYDDEDVEKVAVDCMNVALYNPERRRELLKAQALAVKEGETEKFRAAEKKYIESRKI